MTKLAAALLLASAALAAEPTVIPLWPGDAPGSENWTWQEKQTTGPQGAVARIVNVTRPALTVYLPDPATANGAAVIVCPGGGFRFLAWDYEGTDVARWLNSIGVAAFVLKYRLMRTGDEDEKLPEKMAGRRAASVPLACADGRQAVKLVRSRAKEWGLDPHRIGIMGFSAGGYVAASVALQHEPESRPDFAAPIYPGVPREFTMPPDPPPLFIAHADDDTTVPTLSSAIRLYSEWNKAHAPAELHIYARGGHGFGMRKKGLPVDTWTDRLRDWLSAQGLLKRAE